MTAKSYAIAAYQAMLQLRTANPKASVDDVVALLGREIERAMHAARRPASMECANCGTVFVPRQRNSRFCQPQCYRRWHAREAKRRKRGAG